MKTLLIFLLLATTTHSFAQDWPVKKMVMTAKANKVPFISIPAFSFVANKTLTGRGMYQQISLNTNFNKQLMEQRPDAISISIPLSSKVSITCELVKYNLGNVKFTENNGDVIEHIKLPVTYRGIITSEQYKNTVTLTVNEDYLSLTASMADKLIQITKADEKNISTYRAYNSVLIKFPEVPFDCGNKETSMSKTTNGIDLTGIQLNPLAVQDKCIGVFVDCFDRLYSFNDSNIQKTVNYVYELFNLAATGYFNEQINIQITTVNVWSKPDPYRIDTRKNALFDLANYWKDNFWGNICVGLDYSLTGANLSGIAGGIGRVKAVSALSCPAYDYSGTDSLSACCYNDLNYGGNYSGFPTGPNTTQGQLYLVMHEMGHLFGAHHTQWCGWLLSANPIPIVGAIDNCAPTEGGCSPGNAPSGGGTIMSYCNGGAGQYVNYYNGFGPLPGNAVRNFIDQSACIQPCTECFGWLNRAINNTYAFNNGQHPGALKDKNNVKEEKLKYPLSNKQFLPNLLLNSKK